jgi:hypothetical protein
MNNVDSYDVAKVYILNISKKKWYPKYEKVSTGSLI